MDWSHGCFNWNELMTRDVEKAKQFYGTTLGWTYEGMPMDQGGMYWIAKLGEQQVAGLYQMGGPDFEGVPDCWFPYIAVDDIDARVKTALEKGGSIVKPPFDIPGIGRIGILKDSTGAAIGWITPAPTE